MMSSGSVSQAESKSTMYVYQVCVFGFDWIMKQIVAHVSQDLWVKVTGDWKKNTWGQTVKYTHHY